MVPPESTAQVGRVSHRRLLARESTLRPTSCEVCQQNVVWGLKSMLCLHLFTKTSITNWHKVPHLAASWWLEAICPRKGIREAVKWIHKGTD